jgi:hypothetical protein
MSSPVSRTTLPITRPSDAPPVMWMPSASVRSIVFSATRKPRARYTKMPVVVALLAVAAPPAASATMRLPRTSLPVNAGAVSARG